MKLVQVATGFIMSCVLLFVTNIGVDVFPKTVVPREIEVNSTTVSADSPDDFQKSHKLVSNFQCPCCHDNCTVTGAPNYGLVYPVIRNLTIDNMTESILCYLMRTL